MRFALLPSVGLFLGHRYPALHSPPTLRLTGPVKLVVVNVRIAICSSLARGYYSLSHALVTHPSSPSTISGAGHWEQQGFGREGAWTPESLPGQ